MEKGDRLSNTETLLRRVFFKDKMFIKPDGIPTSRAFTPRIIDEGKLSVDIENLTTYESAILDIEKFRLYKFKAEIPFELGLDCIYDPLSADENNGIENPAHSYIMGFDPDDDTLPSILAKAAEKINYPEE